MRQFKLNDAKNTRGYIDRRVALSPMSTQSWMMTPYLIGAGARGGCKELVEGDIQGGREVPGAAAAAAQLHSVDGAGDRGPGLVVGEAVHDHRLGRVLDDADARLTAANREQLSGVD